MRAALSQLMPTCTLAILLLASLHGVDARTVLDTNTASCGASSTKLNSVWSVDAPNLLQLTETMHPSIQAF